MFSYRPPKVTPQTTYQNAQTAAIATHTTAASAALSFSTASTSTTSVNIINHSNPVLQTASSMALKPKTVSAPTRPQTTTITTQANPPVPPVPPPLELSTAKAIPQDTPQNPTKSSSISNQPPTAKPMLESLPKAVYDSLAPLNLPSKPIFYVNEKQTEESIAETSTVSATTASSDATLAKVSAEGSAASDKDEMSRLDEKAKLESILLSSMSQTSSSYQQKGTFLKISDNLTTFILFEFTVNLSFCGGTVNVEVTIIVSIKVNKRLWRFFS